MDKETFRKALADAGYNCDFRDGIPTVHADSRKVIAGVRKLAKEIGYDQSFGIKFDGAVAPDALDETENAEAVAATEDVSAAGGDMADDANTVPDNVEPFEAAALTDVNSFDLFDEFPA